MNENLDIHCSTWSSSVRNLPRLEDGIDGQNASALSLSSVQLIAALSCLHALASLLRLSWASPPLNYSLGLKLISGPWPVSFDLEEDKVKKVIEVLEPALLLDTIGLS